MSPIRTVVSAILVGLAAQAASAETPVYRRDFRGNPNIQWERPNGDSVGENCHGNCGAGCSNTFDICGSSQWWDQQMLDEPWLDHIDDASWCDGNSGTVIVNLRWMYRATMRETYHGFVTQGCEDHDITCGGGWWNPGCWWVPLPGCAVDPHPDTWSWTTLRWGTMIQTTDYIPFGCTCTASVCAPPGSY